MNHHEIGKRLAQYIEVAQTPQSAAIDDVLIPIIGDTGARVLGLIIGQIIVKVGAEKADDIMCQTIATMSVAMKAAGFSND